MKRWGMLMLTLWLAACSVTSPAPTGVLQGHVTIGPLVPVERQGEPTPTPSPAAYAVRQIVILTDDGRREVTRVAIDAHGDYRVTLAVGRYQVDINRIGMDRGQDLPKIVEILPGQMTRLDIAIDTGIR